MPTAGERDPSPLLLVTTTTAWYRPGLAYRCLTVGPDVVSWMPSPKSHANFASVAALPDSLAPGFDPPASKVTSSGRFPVVGVAEMAAIGGVRTLMTAVCVDVSPLPSVTVTFAVWTPAVE